MKKYTNKLFFIGIILLGCLVMLKSTNAMATNEKDDTITIKYFVILLERVLEKETVNPMDSAVKIGLVRKGEFTNILKPITNEEAAVLINRADVIKNGKNASVEKQYVRALKNGRISDYLDIAEKYRDEVYQTFVKGIMIGQSNGMYSQSRKFYPKTNLRKKEALDIVKILGDVKKRKKMSPDGQLIRTTNLPKNYRRFDYILEAFPNSFYEKKFEFQLGEYPVSLKEFTDYTYPSRIKNMPYVNSEIGTGTVKQHQEMIDNYLDEWCVQVKKNLYYRLNVDYRTIDNKWINNLRSTYIISGQADYDKRETASIKNYVNKVKKNKILIETSKIVVEPSALYYDVNGYKIRCYVKFRLLNTSMKNYVSNDLLYCSFSGITGLEKGKWIERYFDINITPASNNSYGEGYYIGDDFLFEYKDSIIK